MNCACFNIRSTARKITKAYDRELKPVGIRATQFTLLAVLSSQIEKQGINMTTLADQMAMDRTTLTRNLAAAENQGWLTVDIGEDERERTAKLTTSGKRKVKAALPYWQKAQKDIVQHIGPTAMNNILRLNKNLI